MRDQTLEAEVAYRRSLEIDPRQAETLVDLGRLLQWLDRSKEAEDAYRAATQLDAGHEGARYYLARFLRRAGRLEEAAIEFDKLVKLGSKDGQTWNYIGDFYYDDLGRYQDAEAAYAQAIGLQPDRKSTRLN